MDIITHVLAGTTTAQALVKHPGRTRALGLAALLGCTLPDMDVLLLLVSDEAYGRYHRVVPNSLVGAAAISLIAGSLAWAAGRAGWLGRLPLGWIPGVSRDATEPAPWNQCWAFAAWGVATHLMLDWITGWGMWPLWPWFGRDISLRAVHSFDLLIFIFTLTYWAGLHIISSMIYGFYLLKLRFKLLTATGFISILSIYILVKLLISPSTHW